MKWENTTRLAKGEKKGEHEPREWTLEVGDIHVVVYRPYGTDVIWAMHCYAVHLDGVALKAADIVDAKSEAFQKVRAKISNWLIAMDRAFMGGIK
jgi:hypothetical protein